MADVTTSEIQNRITGLKAELDRLSVQLETAQRSGSAEDNVAESPACEVESAADAVVPDERERSVRTLRDLMWQGRWGLAFHLARALEAQNLDVSDFRSSTIRLWALAQDGRRLEGESLRLAEELRGVAPSTSGSSLAARLMDWATRIGVTCGLSAAQAAILAEGFSPPEELPATCEWWLEFAGTLKAASNGSGKWLSLPDQQKAVSEVEELMLRAELEPIRLAASCLMMSLRRAMRHVHVLSTAEEQFILNGELARATTLEFTEKGEVSSDAGVVEKAVCALAKSFSREHQVVMTEVPRAAEAERVSPAADAVAVSALKKGTPGMAAPVRRSTARERLERYAGRLAVPQTHVVAGSAAPVAELPFANEASGGPDQPAASSPAVAEQTGEEHSDSVRPLEREDRRGIHEAALASAFGADGQRAVNSNVRPVDSTTVWGMLLNPQAAIVAALLVIAGAVIVGLGTGLAAKDVVEATTPANEGAETPAEFAGDLPAME